MAGSNHEVIGTKTDSDGVSHDVLEAKRAVTKYSPQGEAWFECPVTLRWMRKSEGVLYRGLYYAPEAVRDILLDKARGR